MIIREGYKYVITTSDGGEPIIIYYNEDGSEYTREAYQPTTNIFTKMNASELAKVKTEMDSEYNFLKSRLSDMDSEYDNLIARQVELINEKQ